MQLSRLVLLLLLLNGVAYRLKTVVRRAGRGSAEAAGGRQRLPAHEGLSLSVLLATAAALAPESAGNSLRLPSTQGLWVGGLQCPGVQRSGRAAGAGGAQAQTASRVHAQRVGGWGSCPDGEQGHEGEAQYEEGELL